MAGRVPGGGRGGFGWNGRDRWIKEAGHGECTASHSQMILIK